MNATKYSINLAGFGIKCSMHQMEVIYKDLSREYNSIKENCSKLQ